MTKAALVRTLARSLLAAGPSAEEIAAQAGRIRIDEGSDVNTQISSETEARLLEGAESRGMSVDSFLQELLDQEQREFTWRCSRASVMSKRDGCGPPARRWPKSD
jgi:hypothetical protein